MIQTTVINDLFAWTDHNGEMEAIAKDQANP